MKLCGIDTRVLPSLPKPQFPPVALGYVHSIAACIGATDAVEIFPSYGCPKICCRILQTSFNEEEVIDDHMCPVHPYIRHKSPLDGPTFFKVQIIILKETSPPFITEEWPELNEYLPSTIPAAAPTNCITWIHSSQIQNIVFLPHAHHCIQQTYGNLSGRVDLYHVNYYAMFNQAIDDSVQFDEIDHRSIDGYNLFGYPTNSHRCYAYTSYSERIFESISQITRCSDALLVKTGAVNGQVSKKLPFPIESFNYLVRMFETGHQDSLEFARNNSFQTKVKITTDNMTLSVDKVKCTRWAISAKNVDGFQAMRSIIGRVGFGVKKKHPNLSAIQRNDGSNRLTIQEHDLIHIVDLDETQILYRDESVEDYRRGRDLSDCLTRNKCKRTLSSCTHRPNQ
jgi:hypothetical protein